MAISGRNSVMSTERIRIDRRSPRAFSAIQSFAVRYGLGIALVIVWEYAARKAGSIFFPAPSESLFQDVIPSLFRLLGGWALAVLIGVPLGILNGRSRNLWDLVNPALQFLRAIPGPALIPIFIILLGTESTMRVTLIAFGSVWPILLNTIEGTRTVDPVQLDTVKAFRIPRHARLWRIVLPAAMPKIFAGMRVSLSLAVILMVVSELVASTSGIGYRIQNAQIMFLLTDMWCGIILLALIGYTLNLLFLKCERRVLAWHRGARGRTAT